MNSTYQLALPASPRQIAEDNQDSVTQRGVAQGEEENRGHRGLELPHELYFTCEGQEEVVTTKCCSNDSAHSSMGCGRGVCVMHWLTLSGDGEAVLEEPDAQTRRKNGIG